MNKKINLDKEIAKILGPLQQKGDSLTIKCEGIKPVKIKFEDKKYIDSKLVKR